MTMSGDARAHTIVIIPARNEALSIKAVLSDIPREDVSEIIVCDNSSTDDTARIAENEGAIVVQETEVGYGAACLAGLSYIRRKELNPDIIVFMDGDRSDHAEELPMLLEPIKNGSADLVIGSRAKGTRERGSMTIPQVFGNWLATRLMKIIFGASFSDLGPFRAISYNKLLELEMMDRNFGWTIEMQVKAVRKGLTYVEIPVSYRKRIGKSKVSGTVRGTFLAGYKILLTIFKYI